MSNLIFSYKENQFALLPFKILGLLVLLIVLISKFFYIGILILVFLYFKLRKVYSKFEVYTDHIIIKNIFNSQKRFKDDFFQVRITPPQLYDSQAIVLKTKYNEEISFVPRHKMEALKIVRILENFGLTFKKSKWYKDLMAWAIHMEQENGQW
ncbi:MAG: hypothetical protein ACWA41_07140 [Putridiphycobacter sp.]